MTSPAQVSSVPPDQLVAGRFEVQHTIVSDGFGQVLAALDRKTGKPVSLRTLTSAAHAAAVRQQWKALGSFQHANVVPTFGVVNDESGNGLLVQGPLAGQHLAAYVEQHKADGKPISLRGAYNVVAHVCNALTAAHAMGPHGAVRPGAVWIGEDGRVQLSDLVIARALLAGGGGSALAAQEAAYLAPEIKAGGAPQPQSDIFGLGALLYVMLTGRSPMDEFIAPSQAHSEATPEIDAELFRALAPDPNARHATPDALRIALLSLMEGAAHGTANDFGVDIEVEVNLASLAPSRSAGAQPSAVSVSVPKAPRVPNIPGMTPEVGSRVSIHEEFRVSLVEDASEAEAARQRRSLGEVDLKDVLAKITEDDAPRWMVVKNGMDHGPFSGRQLVNMIVQGDALRDHDLLNTDTGRRGKVGEFPEFQEFLAQYELVRAEKERAQALANADASEKKTAVFKVGFGVIAVAVVALFGGIYALTRSGASSSERTDAELDMYKRGQLDISGSAGILPMPRPGARRAGRGGGGGGGMSYEDAMMQAIDIGSASGGGEQQLSAQTVAGVVNKHLNGIYNACVKGSVGTVKIDMAIAGSGQVMGVSVSAGDAGFQRCVADQVRRIRFPSFSAPRMGARYTFGT